MSDPGDPFTYNTLEVPTVVTLLRSILSQYPDNGQIIKELVQNAEDAGATKVEVLHIQGLPADPANPADSKDKHEEQRFIQVPSLCLFNNAVFSEEDWQGIRKLGDSIKKNNPLQVGQFGLGFKSVFHLTDYVTIISGQQVLFMDPSEPEYKMCRSLPLKKLTDVLPAAACQQVSGNCLTKQHFSTGNFPGTIFWFPLRQRASKISDTVYTPEHVKCLFKSFAVEADVCLTFLKSLEEITVSEMKNSKVTVSLCMKMTSTDLEGMRSKRQAFRQQLQQCQGSPSDALLCSYQATLQTGVGKTEKQSMRILHYLPGKNDQEWMKWGERETSKHVPLVGVAVPTAPPSACKAKGHIFSFLPLPPDPSNQTHLPIQVNGAFILNQNRRQVKWRTSESSKEPDVIWNEELALKVVATAYTHLLKHLLKETQQGTIDAATWYTFLPNLSNTTGRWQQMAERVWHNILPLSIISSEVCGFLKVQDVLSIKDLNTLKPAIAKTVKSVLCSQSLPLATLPDHVNASMSILGEQVTPITPQYLRDTLNTCGTLDKKWNLQHLLQYAAKDKNYKNLSGLPLLPLQDQSWASFRPSGAAVYLCTHKEAKALLGLEGQVTSVQVDHTVQKILQDIAESGLTQVCRFNIKQHGPSLLLQSVTYIEAHHHSHHQVKEWLSQVWNILQHLNLQSVEHIPLLPSSQPPQAMSLTSLASPVVVQNNNCQLSRAEVEVLALLGVVVVSALPAYIKHIELQGYLYSSDRHGTTQALDKVARQRHQLETVNHFNNKKTEEQRKALNNLIDTHSIQPDLRIFLTKLKMFKAQDMYNSVTDVCIEGVNVIAPEIKDFPVSYKQTLLVPSLPQERKLALVLGALQLSKEELCVKVLRAHRGDENLSRLVSYILKDAVLVGNSTVLKELRNTRFVPNVTRSLCCPSELYDPDDDDCDALIGETQQPDDSFRQHYPLLRSLGLRKVQDMPSNDLIHLIKQYQNTLLSDENRTKKSMGLLRAINRRHDCQPICQAVTVEPFVCGMSSRPLEYPTNLQWATPPGLLRPQDLVSCKYSAVLGSAVAVVQCHDVPCVAEAFGWTKTPHINTVMTHLRNLTAAYQVVEFRRYFSLIKNTYCQLAAFLSGGAEAAALAQLASLKCERCIFTEQGFKTPAQVYIWPGNEDLQLQPYLHPLPMELRESEQLFLHLGCARQQNPSLLLTVLEAVREQHQDDSSSSSREVEQDLRLVVSVLDRLQSHKSELQGPLLVPVYTQDDTLELAEAGQSAYTEAATEWIDSEELNIKVVHQCVSTELAKALGVAPLQNFLSAGGEAVMEWGQKEPLTTRIHNLLRQYRDGVSVLKELVQNADDAGATTVRLLYDERQNEDSRKLVLSTGMGECQGPALWAYNDGVFSEQDFVNLREIGGGTKELQPNKIGKFGLGFCSVYNLTDLPSFVSGSSYVVFDPHMTHLNNVTNSPGIRFNFTDRRNSYMLRTLQGQFQPFRGVFGCDIQECGSFSGTLFRLPFRTPVQASTSKISDTCYSHGDVVQLLKMFSGVVGQLLLFTQHVSSISVFHLCASATKPTEMVEVFHASRSECRPVSIPGLISTPTGSAQSLLERAAALFSQQQHKFKWNGGLLEDRSIAEVSVRHSRVGGDLCGIEDGEWSTTWITSWHTGCGKSCYLAEVHGGKALPLSAVSVPVNEGSNGWQPQCLADLPPGFYREGHFHCFLPLPVKTFLPVQINGVLEVASDRTNLLTQTEDDRCALSWNATLLGDATVHAHLGLAEALRYLRPHGGGLFYAIWPVVGCGGGTLVEDLTKSFYQNLKQKDLELFQCGRGDWHPLSRCLFLEEDFLQVHQVGDIAFEFLEARLYSSSKRLIRLPRHVQAGFDQQTLSQHTITQEVFYQQYFIPHLSEKVITSEKRDQLTLHLLDSGHDYVQLLRPLFCIPTQPHGTLKPPTHLISPTNAIAKMFSVEDERFPLENFLDPSTRSTALTRLGMNTDTISRELVVERAETVAGLALACPECARHRVKELLHYISTQQASKQKELADCLKSIPFLPVMSKPENWSVAWHGECQVEKECELCSKHRTATSESHGASLVLDCPSNLCLPAFKPLVGSSHLILEESLKSASLKMLKKLGVIVHAIDLPVESVVEQLCVFSTAAPQSENVLMCHAIYDHMEDLITCVRKGMTLKSGNTDKIKKLRDKKVLITRHGFKEPKLFAMHSESDCAPDLFSARTEGLEKYRDLMDILVINENFDFDVVMEVIQKKREAFADKRLSDKEVSQVSRLLSVLFKVMGSGVLPTQVLYLPDSRGYLHSTQDLCLDDGLKLSSGKFLYLHRRISVSQDMCEWLGIKSKTRKRLDESSNRLSFGQKEPLTTRLRNILNDYPCDSGIMKELLQNADDAGATEVIFYKDFRHLPEEKLFDPKWAPIQGPALSVFNNKGFTERDIQSIQDLGNSSKNEDPATTGQYGIGFNAVYHLTDAPSFLTRGPEVPQGETLCMFDPHCWYDPAASHESPGVQFVSLNHLRKDHPDSFIGYLEHQLSREGTVFRLPLRTTKDSLISKEIFNEDNINKILWEFERDMPQCLLFLRNVRKISIQTVQQNGSCNEGYSVEASVSEKCNLPVLSTKHGDTQEARDPCSVDMVRTSYRINIHDNKGGSSQWLVVQQLGVEENNLPEIVREAFNLKILNLLPHGAVAILLAMKPGSCYVADSSDIYSTSCYLPLPVKSGLPFSINGHFTLSSSRRELWIGRGDAKGLWNDWLLKEILVPVAVCAVEQFRNLLFPDEDEGYMTEQIYINKVRMFHSVLPLAESAKSEKWKNFVKWFYEQVRNEEIHFFDVFIPETDLPSPSLVCSGASRREEPARERRKGCLRWHAFHISGDEYPVYFSILNSLWDKDLQNIADVFRRLGMKVSSDGMYKRLVTADPEFKCPLLSPEVGLEFIKSWDKDINDRCIPGVGNKVDATPFLKPDNVLSVLKYIIRSKGFSGTCVDKLPLLFTNDGVLGSFSVQNPVFLSSFCDLLPTFGKEFTVLSFVSVIEKARDKFKDVVKKFTPADLGERLPHVFDASNCAPDAKLPITKKLWLNKLWEFVIEFIKEEYCQKGQVDWTQSKTYILRTLGDWALYPMEEKKVVYRIPIKNAWQVLSVLSHSEESVFHKLPVPVSFVRSNDLNKYPLVEKPYIPYHLQLAATLEHPATVLKLLDFHRDSVNSFLQDSGKGEVQTKRGEVQTRDILEYFGKHCQKSLLSKNTIRSLRVFGDPMGQLCTLLDRKLIVVAESVLKLDQLKGLCAELSFLIISKPESVYLTDLYTYIEPNCMVGELDLYTRIILPNLSSLNEKQRKFYLKHLNKNFSYNQKRFLNHDQQSVVAALKSCPFIELDGTLNTADKFYDPTNPVFSVMGVANLPEAWGDSEWQNMLRLAGMVHEVTPDKFVEFASSLSLKDENVKKKSEELCQYLSDHHQDFQLKIHEILEIQFLVPKICDKLKTLLPHHQTHSGLVAFSKGVNPKFAHIIWSTSSVLPSYASKVARKLQQQDNTVNMDTPPVADVLKHIVRFCSSMQETPEKSPEVVKNVMESIYNHLSESEDNEFKTLKERDIPLIHIPDHKVFVPIKHVVGSLEEEILPYLYKAPVFYGKFFNMLKKLGMPESVTVNTYAHVLRMIHDSSKHNKLHPQESQSMKIALTGLVKLPYKLKDLSVPELFLPTRDETLRSSSEVFVADNTELLLAIEKTFHEPVFVGFQAMKIFWDDSFFVKVLPGRLQPKFLSEACKENLQHEGMLEEDSELLVEIQELLQSDTFKIGVLRIVNHYKLQQGSGLTEEDRKEIVALLARVTVKQVNSIKTTLTLHNNIVGHRDRKFFLQVNGEGAQKTLTLYLSTKIPRRLVSHSLYKMYRRLLEKWSIDQMKEFSLVVACYGKPHDINNSLNEADIKMYSGVTSSKSLFKCDVGSYLQEEFLPLLDNGFSEFYEREIVCMRKYLCSNERSNSDEEDDDIFVIVEVVRLVDKHATNQMLNTYEVNTSKLEPCLVITKAYQLFRFVRKENDGATVEASATAQNVESKEEIFRKIRKQVKEIWQVKNEQERRHLFRRLKFKWHPDKNPNQVELCTSVMQYIQSLVGRLERGEAIPDDEDPMNAPHSTPSEAYSSFFRPPPRQYRRRNNRGARDPPRPRPDLPEARRWHRQARTDLRVAESLLGESPSWAVFVCYQAAEKVLLAALYMQDMELASRKVSNGPLHRTLGSLARCLNNPNAVSLSTAIHERTGGFLRLLYPTFRGCPQDCYTQMDAQETLLLSRELLQVLGELID